MIRPQFHEVLGHVVHARIALDGLEQGIIDDLRGGNPPTYRGHQWGPDHVGVVEAVHVTLDTTFDLLKWLQFPEVRSRRYDALKRVLDALPPIKEIT